MESASATVPAMAKYSHVSPISHNGTSSANTTNIKISMHTTKNSIRKANHPPEVFLPLPFFMRAANCFHCSFQRDREKCGTNGCCDPWLLCVPYCVDLHSVRTFSHDPIPVSSLFLLLVYYFCCGSPLFCLQLPRAESTFIMQAVSSCVLSCGRNRSTPPGVKW